MVLPGFMQFTASNRTFRYSSFSQADVGFYNIAVSGTSSSGNLGAFFTMTVVNPCLTATLVASVIPDYTYIIGNGTLTITFNEFTRSNTYCQSDYDLTDQSNNAFRDPPIASFTNSTRTITV